MKYLKTYENNFINGDIVHLNPNKSWNVYYPYVKIISIKTTKDDYYKVEVLYGKDRGRTFYVSDDSISRRATPEDFKIINIEIDAYKYNI